MHTHTHTQTLTHKHKHTHKHALTLACAGPVAHNAHCSVLSQECFAQAQCERAAARACPHSLLTQVHADASASNLRMKCERERMLRQEHANVSIAQNTLGLSFRHLRTIAVCGEVDCQQQLRVCAFCISSPQTSSWMCSMLETNSSDI
jgi:hypothetical protein